jgi:hypothetical protein
MHNWIFHSLVLRNSITHVYVHCVIHTQYDSTYVHIIPVCCVTHTYTQCEKHVKTDEKVCLHLFSHAVLHVHMQHHVFAHVLVISRKVQCAIHFCTACCTFLLATCTHVSEQHTCTSLVHNLYLVCKHNNTIEISKVAFQMQLRYFTHTAVCFHTAHGIHV